MKLLNAKNLEMRDFENNYYQSIAVNDDDTMMWQTIITIIY